MFPNIKTFSASTRTAQEAADQIGCALGAIGKSLIFRSGDDMILIITSGTNRVDTERVGKELGVTLGKADADFVKAKTGFSIGGVAPWGYERPAYVVIDADLEQYPEIWAAAGTPHSVFPTTFGELQEKTRGVVMKVASGA
ncbi:YbaK/EbsC family protein [bacterium]|nr:YbaK/EbsC family protein [bacterium]